MARRSSIIVFAFFLAFLFINVGFCKEGGKKCSPPVISEHPAVEEIMAAWFDIKFQRFADDISYGPITYKMIDKTGFTRTRIVIRKRISLHGKRGFDYKDLVIVTYPENVKGLAVLTWAYDDAASHNDIWMWIPSLKRIRRTCQADLDDSFLGSEFTTDDVTIRRLGNEKYKLLTEKNFPGYESVYAEKICSKGLPCFVVEAIPKRKTDYYKKRIVWINKKTGAAVFDEYYDVRGRKFKIIYRAYVYPEDGCIRPEFWEVKNLRTGHVDTIGMGDITFNTDVPEKFFTEKTLERSQW